MGIGSTTMVKCLLVGALLTLVGAAASVGARDLSGYPCTVFDRMTCFRLPAGTRLEYDDPADFDLYRVFKGDALVATIYVGAAPRPADDDMTVETIRRRGERIEMHRSRIDRRSEIFITGKGRAGTIHVMSPGSPTVAGEFLGVISSLRLCRPVERNGLRCDAEPVWRGQLPEFLRDGLLESAANTVHVDSAETASQAVCDSTCLIPEPTGIFFVPGQPTAGDTLVASLSGRESVAALQKNANLLLCSWEGVPLRVVGFTDPSECEGPACRALSQRRALLFHEWLVAHGVPHERLLPPLGLANTQPIREPGTPDAPAWNARAYIRIETDRDLGALPDGM